MVIDQWHRSRIRGGAVDATLVSPVAGDSMQGNNSKPMPRAFDKEMLATPLPIMEANHVLLANKKPAHASLTNDFAIFRR